MKTVRTLIIYTCIAAGFAACKGNSTQAKKDSAEKINLTKDSSGTLSDSTMGKVPPDSSKKAAPATTGPKGHVDSVTKQ